MSLKIWMKTRKWPTITVKGDLELPRVCPNCLAPADVRWRTSYKSGSTTFYHDFYYCGACAEILRTEWKYHRRKTLLEISVVLVPVILFLTCFYAFGWDMDKLVNAVGKLLLSAIVLYLVAVPVWIFILWRLAKKRCPLRPEQAVWGEAVYYTGGGLVGGILNYFNDIKNIGSGGTQGKILVFRALRPEWLKALVEANPMLVDNATYERWAGVPKPEKYGRFE